MGKEKLDSRTITLKDLFEIFLRRWMWLLLAAVIAGGGFLMVDKVFTKPEYTSTAVLYILRQNEDASGEAADASGEWDLALKIIKDCNYILKSRTVINQVIKELELPYTYEELFYRISTYNPSNTRILQVSVEANDPEMAQKTVNRICEVGREKIKEAMGVQQIQLYEYGGLPNVASNSKQWITYAMIAAAAAIVIYLGFVIAFLMDDRIRSDEDVERMLGLSVLGCIPLGEDQQKKRSSYQSGKHSRVGAGKKDTGFMSRGF